MRAASAVSRANCAKNAHEHTGQRRRSDIPRAMVLRLTPRSPWRPGLFATIAPRIRHSPRPVGPTSPPRDLTPASGRQDHTTLPSASAPFVRVRPAAHGKPALRPRFTPDAACVHCIPYPTSVTIARAPLKRDGMVRVIDLIRVSRQVDFRKSEIKTNPTWSAQGD